MIRGLNLILLLTSLLALVGVYGVKFRSEAIQTEKNALTREVAQQKDQLSVLQADWAHFSQPTYIAPIVERHAEALNLQTVQSSQFVSIADLPMRPEQINEDGLTSLFESLEAGIDPIGDQLSEILDQ